MNNTGIRVARQRLDFSKIKTSIPIPNLIEVQKKSYERFLQMDLLPSERDDTGLESVFRSVFPISDFRGLSQLEFVDYSIGNWECKCSNLKGLHHLRSTCKNPACGATIQTDPFHPGEVLCHRCGTFNRNIVTFCSRCGDPVGLQLKHDVPECEERGMAYAAPLKVTIRLTVYDKDPETGAKSIRDIKEQEVFFGEIPLMTDNGTFIINGTERVIVSQLHRSPGVFFERQQALGYFLGKIIPYRGSWVEFEYEDGVRVFSQCHQMAGKCYRSVSELLELAGAYRYFPKGTIFLVVVDPGVGSSRRGVAVEAGDFRFVAPDNGVLTTVLDEVKKKGTFRYQ